MKKIYIIAVFFIIIVILAFAGWKLNSTSETSNEEVQATPTAALPTVSDSIKVNLTPKNGNKSVLLEISGLTSDIDSVEYELTYLTGTGLPRGVLGKIKTDGKSEISRDDIVLGTCSSGKCVYDSGVTSLDLSLKFNYPDGSKVFRKTYSL